MLDEKAFFITINQVATLSLQTYGMTVKICYYSTGYFGFCSMTVLIFLINGSIFLYSLNGTHLNEWTLMNLGRSSRNQNC